MLSAVPAPAAAIKCKVKCRAFTVGLSTEWPLGREKGRGENGRTRKGRGTERSRTDEREYDGCAGQQVRGRGKHLGSGPEGARDRPTSEYLKRAAKRGLDRADAKFDFDKILRPTRVDVLFIRILILESL